MSIAALITNPTAIKMSANLWKAIKVEHAPDHRPPVIQKTGLIDGNTNPPMRPETAEEFVVGIIANIYRNIRVANQGRPDAVLAVDQNGRILGNTCEEIVPETDSERIFWQKRSN